MLYKATRSIISNFSQFVKLSTLNAPYQSVVKLELNNPKKKNALSLALLDQLDEKVKQIGKTPSLRAVILQSSQPKYFCAGADLKQRIDKTSEQLEGIVYNLRRIFNDIRNIHCPVFCLVDGPALGGGLQLALNADIRVGTKDALVGLPQTYWSLIPGAGGTQTLSRVIGVPKAKEMIFLAKKINGVQAQKLGIFNYCEEDFEGAQKKIMSLIDQMLPLAPLGIKHAKKAINWGSQVDLRTALEIQRFNYERMTLTQDMREGFKSFVEKRKPKYQGK